MKIIPFFFTTTNINFSASSLSMRSPSMGNVWNISASTCIPQTCHLNCDNWHTKGAQLRSGTFHMASDALWRYPYWWWEHYPSLAISPVVTQNLQDEDDRRRAFVHHSSHPAIPESTQSYDTTRCKRRIKRASDVWCVCTLKGNPILLVIAPACKAEVWCHRPTLQNTLVNNETQHCILQQKE